MVGGTVCEVLDCGNRVWVNVRGEGCEQSTECAVYVERNPDSLKVAPGDAIWWQSREAMWTPQQWRGRTRGGDGYQGVRWDITIPRIGYSGASHPAKSLIESAFTS